MSEPLCTECPFRGRPKVPSEGDPNTCKYVLIGEAPAHDEVRQGRPFVGQTGRLLMAFLTREGIKREECYITNVILCQLPRTKARIPEALRCCRPRLLSELASINTGATMAIMGGIARDSLYPGERGGIMAARGWRKLGDRDVYVMAHPAYYLYNPNEAPMLQKDLKRLKRGRQPPPEVCYEVLEDINMFRGFVSNLQAGLIEHGRYIAVDLETDQVDFQRDRILCMSISPRYGQAYIVPDSVLYEDGKEFVTVGKSKAWWERFSGDFRYITGRWLRPRKAAVDLITKMFKIPGVTWCGHVFKFDLRFLVGQLGVVPPVSTVDTIDMHYVLDERKGGHALKPLADDYFDTGNYEAELFEFIAKKSAHYSGIPRRVLYKYNAMDTEVTLRFAYTFEGELRRQGLWERPFLFPIMAAEPMLLQAEIAGVNIDWKEFERIEIEELNPELKRVAMELRFLSGVRDLNPLSSKKVNDIMYDHYKFPIIEVRTRAAGKRIKKRSSQKAVMDGWEKMWKMGTLHVSEAAWEFATRLIYYRHLRKMQGSYIRKWRKYRGIDDRVHTSFHLRGTVTGRLSSTDPPMQTIPSKIKERWSLLVANAHIPADGWSFAYADYSQAELMAAACLSGDEFMLEAYRKEDADYHSEVALAAFGPNFTHDERQHCKRLTFGWLYGGNVEEIALNALQFEGDVAKRFAHEWDDMFGGVLSWRANQGKIMRQKGYVESVFGRRRRFLLLSDKNIGKAMRIAVNAPIQSAVSDLTLVSACRLHDVYKNTDYARVILLIHDSLILEVKDAHLKEVEEVMAEVMLQVAAETFPQIPFRADVKIGRRLGDLT